ncbi:unnamed protein product [Lactuca virosa]|uniref:DDE Tnp4 domain-containing protein n=1 Tax=Lactuca virosa TaxID=75947 RepID=A0AAU9MCF1_9ASTR|nr:unnamed protein product [Lactuca virosa]
MSSSSSSSGIFDALLETTIEVVQEAEQMINQLQQENVENALWRKRRYIQRFREAANERLMQDYFVDDTTFKGYLRYLHKPTCSDIQQSYAHHSNVHDFPGMLGSLDCIHWAWGCCPNPHKGQYTCGDHGYPNVILEAMASQDMWIWHAVFGSAGSPNDINVLNMSLILDDIYNGTAPNSSF